MVNCTAKELDILKHSLGLTKYKRDGKYYRNYFVAGNGSEDDSICAELEVKGLMISRPYTFAPDTTIYFVTEEGKKLAEDSCQVNPSKKT